MPDPRKLLVPPLPQEDALPERVPLSFAQQRLWFLEQLEPDTPLYNVPLALRIRGALQVDLLRAALDQVVARHEALRSGFLHENGSPVQFIREPRPVGIQLIDLDDRGTPGGGEGLQTLLRREAQRPFDLRRDLLIRATLFRVRETDHVLLLSLHHIVCDEWSLRVLLRELTRNYDRLRGGDTTPLPELPIQYADYALWQRDWLQGQVLGKELDYWKQQLQGPTPRLDLPTGSPPPTGKGHEGRREFLDLPRPVLDGLRELSRREGATLFMTLLASLKALLCRYAGQDQVIVGSPISGRTRLETEDLIGFFVNTLVLRTDLAGDPTFLEILGRVRDVTLGACDHQELPFEKLVEELQPARLASGVPLLQVIFALQQPLDQDVQIPGLELQVLEVDNQTAKFDLTCVAMERPEKLQLCIEYATALFADDSVARLLSHWQNLLHAVVDNPNLRLSQIPLLAPSEGHRAIVEWNQTDRDYPQDTTLAALFEKQVERRAEAMAVCYGSAELCYAELNRRANVLAHHLRQLGVGPEVTVGLCLERSVGLVVGMLGILKAGGGYVPLDPSYPKERLSLMLEDAQPSAIVTQESLRPALPATRATLLTLDSLPETPSGNPAPAGKPDDLAYVIYTSGSTGRPKGVLVTQRGILRLVCNADYVRLTEADRIAQLANPSFDAATFEIWGALVHGAALIGLDRHTALCPKELAMELVRQRITTLFLTTALFNQVAAEAPGAFRPLKHLLFGGEVVDPKRVRDVLRHQPPERLLHVYGPTETTTFASWHRVTEVPVEARTIPIGRPIANTRIYLLDRWLEPVPVGVPGEIHIGGPGVARGYLHQPQLTTDRFVRDPFTQQPGAKLYKTGDLGRYRADGTIEFIGRLDEQVKIRGFRVELGEIETALATHPAVSENVVIAREEADPSLGKRLAAYVVLREGRAATAPSELRQFLKQKLPPYMLPSHFVLLPKLPLSGNGKVDRRALPAPDAARPDPGQDFLPPRSPVEKQLAALWSDVLGVERVGVQDNFFDLGGHSLLAVRLFAQIEKTFGRRLPLASLFQWPTVEGLADLIHKDQASASWPLLVEIQAHGAKPPIFWVHSLGGDGGGAFFYYRKLAQLLGPEQPSFGIRSPQEPFTRIPEMAARYVEELRRAQSEGPYFLGGFCFGGVVAFEMACQLHDLGQEVGLLALLESAPPCPSKGKLQWGPQAVASLTSNFQSWLGDLLHQTPSELCSRLQRKGKSFQKRLQRVFRPVPSASDGPELADFIDMSHYPKDYIRYAQAHWQSLLAYEPQPYPGRITLFRARKQPLLNVDPTLGWRELAQDGVAVNIIPGTHEKLLEEPNVHILAAELKLCLVEAQSAPAPAVSSGHRTGAADLHPTSMSCSCSIIT